MHSGGIPVVHRALMNGRQRPQCVMVMAIQQIHGPRIELRPGKVDLAVSDSCLGTSRALQW